MDFHLAIGSLSRQRQPPRRTAGHLLVLPTTAFFTSTLSQRQRQDLDTWLANVSSHGSGANTRTATSMDLATSGPSKTCLERQV
ncbi:hypothetical protein CGGC5_v016544 [Colletotrichum fructicola Nara gc5]|uniref:Uncharacterized protein n=1 Tax=Colletotrichum fructicola (strain Nara gc5) TaxID=1213859 RepID=A0A7J6IE58_COLFN|nr:hypothetical protein CGGC5_v016544 [Colletotrichum fructicola Nara gc5]